MICFDTNIFTALCAHQVGKYANEGQEAYNSISSGMRQSRVVTHSQLCAEGPIEVDEGQAGEQAGQQGARDQEVVQWLQS